MTPPPMEVVTPTMMTPKTSMCFLIAVIAPDMPKDVMLMISMMKTKVSKVSMIPLLCFSAL